MDYITPEQYQRGTLAKIPKQKRGRGNPKSKTKVSYKDVICTFDIETSRLQDIEQSIMYVWMLHLHHHCTIVGRTWDQLAKLFATLSAEAGEETLCVFIHNLSYEFQFMRAIHEFETSEVFAVESRRVLKATMQEGKIEMRCSYLHSNMSLAEYTTKLDVEHKKLDGDTFDYNKERYPWTPLSDYEIRYCLNDVIGLAEAIEKEMEADNDNLYTFPLTSTGYVRRDAKQAMRKAPQGFVRDQLPDLKIFQMCAEAFRGGDTHANRYYSGLTLKNVKSADRSSSYPEVVCNCQFPVSRFFHAGEMDFDRLMYLITVRKKAVIMRVSMTNVRLIDDTWGAPYLSRDKCRRIERGAYDNGRILTADYLETTITDIDLRIIVDQYDFDDLCAFDVAYARYGRLPESLINTTISYYKAKTELKDVSGQEVYYMKSKNKLNSIYGMMAQKPVKQDILFNKGEWSVANDPLEELLEVSNSKAFLCYQWGVWVTAHARAALQEGIKLAGDRFVYCDTDSVKYLGEIDWTEYNNGRIAASKKSGAFATDPKGNTHYMGVYEQEHDYNEFKTLGAKKYAYNFEPGGKTFVTIAGVTKRKGGAELDRYGGLDAFKPGFVFVEAGGTESIYNDNPTIQVVEREGRYIPIYPNIVIKDSTYTLGITEEYRTLLENSKLPLDFWRNL